MGKIVFTCKDISGVILNDDVVVSLVKITPPYTEYTGTLDPPVGNSNGVRIFDGLPESDYNLEFNGIVQTNVSPLFISGESTGIDSSMTALLAGIESPVERAYTGEVNGENPDFVVDPILTSSFLLVFLGGVLQTPGIRYNLIDGTTIRFIVPPIRDDDLRVLSTHSISAGVISEIQAGAVGTINMAGASVTSDKLASQSVDVNKIQDSAITSGKIAQGAVSAGHIQDTAVTKAKLNANVFGPGMEDAGGWQPKVDNITIHYNANNELEIIT